ncbi:hypothetical protein, unlikely [Trypanosoma congolense IL3000]|uniref:Uncharacterized protein n=1 Tax=Trypanosoma congolense (strain IL3000) TaxID=1068625 RepID=F9WHB0_TRYCI|nr:hypothetical protein, unlikely [Trypanosoma congolense IL3000]
MVPIGTSSFCFFSFPKRMRTRENSNPTQSLKRDTRNTFQNSSDARSPSQRASSPFSMKDVTASWKHPRISSMPIVAVPTTLATINFPIRAFLPFLIPGPRSPPLHFLPEAAHHNSTGKRERSRSHRIHRDD